MPFIAVPKVSFALSALLISSPLFLPGTVRAAPSVPCVRLVKGQPAPLWAYLLRGIYCPARDSCKGYLVPVPALVGGHDLPRSSPGVGQLLPFLQALTWSALAPVLRYFMFFFARQQAFNAVTVCPSLGFGLSQKPQKGYLFAMLAILFLYWFTRSGNERVNR